MDVTLVPQAARSRREAGCCELLAPSAHPALLFFPHSVPWFGVVFHVVLRSNDDDGDDDKGDDEDDDRDGDDDA